MRWPIDWAAIVAALLSVGQVQATIIADPDLLDETANPIDSIISLAAGRFAQPTEPVGPARLGNKLRHGAQSGCRCAIDHPRAFDVVAAGR